MVNMHWRNTFIPMRKRRQLGHLLGKINEEKWICNELSDLELKCAICSGCDFDAQESHLDRHYKFWKDSHLKEYNNHAIIQKLCGNWEAQRNYGLKIESRYINWVNIIKKVYVVSNKKFLCKDEKRIKK